MKEYNNIKCWCENPEQSALDQAKEWSEHPATFKHVALMPDTHKGYSLPVGGVVALNNCISPMCVGVDIACGMLAVKTTLHRSELNVESLTNIMHQVKRDVPTGYRKQKDAVKNHTDSMYIFNEEQFLPLSKVLDIKFFDEGPKQFQDLVACSLGTLGGGNHFLEIQHDENDNIWIMIHSGSRNLGKKIAEFYHKIAVDLCNKWKVTLPNKNNDLAFLPVDTKEGMDYIKCMKFCENFSYTNRICMLSDIHYALNRVLKKETFDITGKDFEDKTSNKIINIHHNYARLENHFGKNVWVHRKGATSAKKDELGIIPGSMGTHSYIVRGKGNIHSFNSCSHGAGRTMSRTAAQKEFGIIEFKEKMSGVVSKDVDEEHIDESPMAYKDINVVMEEQKDLVEIVHILSPLMNIKD